MANQQQLAILRQGVQVWNAWRNEIDESDPPVDIDLSGADLSEANLHNAKLNRTDLTRSNLVRANLSGANLINSNLSRANLAGANCTKATLFKAGLVDTDFRGAILHSGRLNDANLCQANLSDAKLTKANLKGANLEKANLSNADLSDCKLIGADLSEAILDHAVLYGADLTGGNLSRTVCCNANLCEANLIEARLHRTNLSNTNMNGANLGVATLLGANLTGAVLDNCRVYGISIWDSDMTGATQRDLIITPEGQPVITVDNLKVAQFIYLIINNNELRQVIDTITSKVVLILGNFRDERKQVLDAMRDELRRHHDYVPVLFDFSKPDALNYNETVTLLARMARFIIVDITEALEVRSELNSIGTQLASVPVRPLLQAGQEEWKTYGDYRNRNSILPLHQYQDCEELITNFRRDVIDPAEALLNKLRGM